MQDSNIIALDVGTKRIGVARAHSSVGIPSPFVTLENNDGIFDTLKTLIQDESVSKIIVGLPRSLHGNDTDQTTYTRDFIRKLSGVTDILIETQDEALTSHKAEEELVRKKQGFSKGDVDALAATYILEDYFAEQG